MNEIDILTSEKKLAEKVARQAASRWSAVNAEDAISHLYLWLTENYEVLVRYRSDPYGTAKLTVALKRSVSKYCVKEQTYANGGTLNDSFFYTSEQIKRTLQYIWELNSWSQTIVAESKKHINADVFDNALSIIADISSAYYDLDKHDQKILEMRYRYTLSIKQIAQNLETTEKIIEKKISTAISHLHSKLGGPTPYSNK